MCLFFLSFSFSFSAPGQSCALGYYILPKLNLAPISSRPGGTNWWFGVFLLGVLLTFLLLLLPRTKQCAFTYKYTHSDTHMHTHAPCSCPYKSILCSVLTPEIFMQLHDSVMVMVNWVALTLTYRAIYIMEVCVCSFSLLRKAFVTLAIRVGTE